MDEAGQVLTICLPTPDARTHVGEWPDVRALVWDGTGEPPAGVAAVEFFVGRYDAAPPAREVFGLMPALRVLQLLSAGYEAWKDLVPAGVTLCNGRGVHGASTAELALAGMLASLRRLPRFLDAQRAGQWSPAQARGLAGRRVLVLGAGDIGRRVAEAVRPLDAEVTLVARTARPGVHTMDDLPQLLPAHDVVVVAVPLTGETHHLVDAAFLALLPDQALLVNVARGAVVDTEALLAELTSGRLNAFLDVTDPEPLPAGHPLWTAPNLLLTPHVGGGTVGWQQRAYALVRDQVRRYQRGDPLLNVVG
jgi:phosphoglycerate dehydrogenase-like enzyme